MSAVPTCQAYSEVVSDCAKQNTLLYPLELHPSHVSGSQHSIMEGAKEVRHRLKVIVPS